MIFGAKHPFLSEPSMTRANPLSPKSVTFTKHVQCKTVFHAMIWWLTSNSAKDGIWGNVSSTYWAMKGREVLNTVREWAKTNEELHRYEKEWRYLGQIHDTHELTEPQKVVGINLLEELNRHLGSEIEIEGSSYNSALRLRW
jgi:hypothetical protein